MAKTFNNREAGKDNKNVAFEMEIYIQMNSCDNCKIYEQCKHFT
jgi:hypothetical protein